MQIPLFKSTVPFPHVAELDGLRGLLAVWVVLGHALAALPELPGLQPNLHNSSAVEVFIMISGFSISALLSGKFDGYWRYLAARALRIFPVYWVCLAVSALLITFAQQTLLLSPPGYATESRLAVAAEGIARFWTHLAVHIPLAQGLVPPAALPYAHVTILGQAWSLSLEWQFYLLAPMLIFFSSSLGRWTSCAGLIISVSLLMVLGRPLTDAFLGNSVLLFAVGIGSQKVFQAWQGKISATKLLSIGIFLVAVLLFFSPKNQLALAIWALVFIGIMAPSASWMSKAVASVLRGASVTYLGRISYPLYLVHMVALFVCLRVMTLFEMTPIAKYWALPLACLILSIGFSVLLHQFIERPFHEIGRTLSHKRRAKRRAATVG